MRTGQFRTLVLGLALLAAAPACIEEQELKLYIQREETVDGKTCFRPCNEAPAEPFGDECPGETAVTCGLIPGFDRIRVAAEYGSFALAGDEEPPTPTLEFLYDGQAPLVRGGEQPRALGGGEKPRWVSLSTLPVPLPAGPATLMRVKVKVTEEFETELVQPLSMGSLRPGLSTTQSCPPGTPCVLSQSVGKVTFMVEVPEELAGDTKLESWLDNELRGTPIPVQLKKEGSRMRGPVTLDVPGTGSSWRLRATAGGYESLPLEFTLKAPTLTLLSTGCPAEASSCGLRQATGTVALELLAPSGLAATQVKIETALDNQPPQVAKVVELAETDNRLVARAWLDVPERGNTLQVFASAGSFTSNSLTFQLAPPEVQVGLRGCGALDGCVLEAAVGTVYVDVRAPDGFRPEKVRVHQSVDGTPPTLADEQPFEVLSTGKAAVLSLRVPDAGERWSLRVTAGEVVLKELAAQLRPPSFSVSVLGCVAGTECQVRAGSQVTVEVDVPAASHEAAADLTYRVSSGPLAARTPVQLDRVSGDRRIGAFTLTVPADAANKRLQFFAYLGQHESRSQDLLVTPP